MHSEMVTLQTMDSIFYELQMQGRISFYLTTSGKEAVNIASAAALSSDDVILPQVCFFPKALKFPRDSFQIQFRFLFRYITFSASTETLYNNSLINASETQMILVKEDKCRYTTALTNTITSQSRRLLRHNFLKL
ncbi:unnamed protein product [Lathyrus sativus]|nr:unnamed protein product [Lathyrus sativus]